MHLQDTPIPLSADHTLRRALVSLNRVFLAPLLCTWAVGTTACDTGTGTDIGPDGEEIPRGALVVMDAWLLLSHGETEPKDGHMFAVVDVVVRNPDASALLISPAAFRVAVGGLELGPTNRLATTATLCPTGFIAPGGLVRCEVAFEVTAVPSSVIFVSGLEGTEAPVRREKALGAMDLPPVDIGITLSGVGYRMSSELSDRGEVYTVAVQPVTKRLLIDVSLASRGTNRLAVYISERVNGVEPGPGGAQHPIFVAEPIPNSEMIRVAVDADFSGWTSVDGNFDDIPVYELVYKVEHRGVAPVDGLTMGREISVIFVPDESVQ